MELNFMSDESNKKHAPKRNKPQIEQDKADISRCYLNSMGQRQIVEWIAKNRPYTLSLGMVNRIIQEVVEEWRKINIRSIEEMKAVDLARIENIYRNAYEGFERSCRDLVVERRVNGKLCTITQKRDGDPRWLAIMLDCIKQRGEILGYSKSPESELGGQDELMREIGPSIELALQIAYGPKRAPAVATSVHWANGMQAPRQS